MGPLPYLMANPVDAVSSLGLVQFDLSAVAPGTIVTNASLILFQTFSNAQSGATTLDIYRNTSPWQEFVVTYLSKPAIDPTPVASLPIGDGAAGSFRTWDVTPLVAGWVNGAYPNYGMTLAKSPDQAIWPMFVSREGFGPVEQRPSLAITFADPVPEPGYAAGVSVAIILILFATRQRGAL